MSGKYSLSSSPFSGRHGEGGYQFNFGSTPRTTAVSFHSELDVPHGVPGADADLYKTSSEMNALRSIQTARAVVASERQKLLNKTQMISEKTSTSPASFEPSKKASEEQLFEEVALLMQERDLLLREKSALQAILTSSAEEIRRLFDGEQKHVAEMKDWLAQKEVLEHDRDAVAEQLSQVQKEAEVLRKDSDKLHSDKHQLENTQLLLQRDQEDMQDKIVAMQQELSIRRSTEQTHKEERSEWTRQQDEYSRQLAAAQAETKTQAVSIQQLKFDAELHRKNAEHWEEERTGLLEDRAEKERLKIVDAEHKEEQRRWNLTHEQLLKERTDANAQLQLSLQQMEQQQKTIEAHNAEKAQWLKQQDLQAQARATLEARNQALEDEINRLRQQNLAYQRDKEEAVGKVERLELDLTESGRHLAAARTDFERVKQQKEQLTDDMEVLRRELDGKKQEVGHLEGKLRETRTEVSRLTEYEGNYNHEREEKLLLESKLNTKITELQEALRNTQLEGRQLQELSDALRTEVQQLGQERQGLLEERSRLQYRLKLTLQELEHLRSNEKRYETESAEWLHTHSTLLERVLRHGRDGH